MHSHSTRKSFNVGSTHSILCLLLGAAKSSPAAKPGSTPSRPSSAKRASSSGSASRSDKDLETQVIQLNEQVTRCLHPSLWEQCCVRGVRRSHPQAWGKGEKVRPGGPAQEGRLRSCGGALLVTELIPRVRMWKMVQATSQLPIPWCPS